MKALPISGDAKSYAVLLGVGVVGVLVLYWFFKREAKAGADALGGALFGDSPLQNSHNADGSVQDDYRGKGALGTVAAGANNATGGYLSSIGESIGGALADLHDWFVLDDPTKTPKLQSRKQATQDNFHIDSSGVFLP